MGEMNFNFRSRLGSAYDDPYVYLVSLILCEPGFLNEKNLNVNCLVFEEILIK